jgi:DNA repair protein RadD
VISLRYYQEDAVSAMFQYFEGNGGNPLWVLPTAAGKSVVISEFVRRAIEMYPGTRVLVLSHVAELLVQNHAKLMSLWPDAPSGLYSAGLKRRDINAQVLFAGIQSIHKHAYKLQSPPPDIIIIDEAHLVSPNDSTTYRKFITDLKQINPWLKIIGATATHYRLDSGWLHQGDRAMFTDIAYEISVSELIEKGYLSPLISKGTATRFDLRGVGTRGGDYVEGQLSAAVDKEEVTQAAVAEIVSFGQDRRCWLVFCTGVAHAYNVRDEIRKHGFTCETITGETPAAERNQILSDYRAGKIRAITNANCLTTGVDVPAIDLIAFMRPTKSTSLYIQMAGRGCRLADNKDNCLCLDFADVVATHGPIDRVRVKEVNEGKGGDAPTKTCEVCETICHASVRECPDCGFKFPEPKTKLNEVASVLPIMSTEPPPPPEWVNVTGVSYRCGLTFHREWVCLQHTGFARSKAVTWWRARIPDTDPRGLPDDNCYSHRFVPPEGDGAIGFALDTAEYLKRPSRILVKQGGKYPEIVGYDFTEARNDEVTEARIHDFTKARNNDFTETRKHATTELDDMLEGVSF